MTNNWRSKRTFLSLSLSDNQTNKLQNTIIHNNDLSMSFCYNRLYHTKERKDNA